MVLERVKGMAAASKYPVELKERAVAMVRELEGGPPRLLWRPDHLSHTAGCCMSLRCQKASRPTKTVGD
jgi:hypothetical protein